jgi:tRNA dimethylallyltransferase
LSERIPVGAVVGPTASGKSRLAVALCKSLSGEVISADSMQIYRGIPIGTAQPSQREMGNIEHHLIGFLPLDQPFSVADYVKLAERTVNEVRSRGKFPMLCGGTGLYIRSFLHHIDFEQAVGDHAFRTVLEERWKNGEGDLLYRELQTLDAKAAEKIHPNNEIRVIRALELLKSTGKTAKEREKESRMIPSPYDCCMIGLNFRSRDILYQRINERVDQMMKQGLLEEAEKVFREAKGSTAIQAIGYKELKPYFEGICSLPEAVDCLKQHTRNYAKRQLTWFRREEQIHWLFIEDYPDFTALCQAALRIFETNWGADKG